MKRFEHFLLLSLFLLLLFSSNVNSEYWFQSGVRGGQGSAENGGASAEIQTVTPQNVSSGSLAFWVGENLPNGAFLQVGYLIENQSGDYPTNCTVSGCSDEVPLKAGDAEWFYEYFTPKDNNTFFGSIGPDNSTGANGAFNKYSFYSLGNTWYFLFNNKTLGTADLGISSSGPEWPIAVGEVANTSNSATKMAKVTFSNLSAYQYDTFLPVSSGYATINYGVGSKTNLPNPYGVQEIGNRVNYFEVGSGLSLSNNNTQVWTPGHRLKISSAYGNLSNKNVYLSNSEVPISVPKVIEFNDSSRIIFQGWQGSGTGSYTGSSNATTLTMNGNITETANWQMQYYVYITSSYGNVTGGGWYNNGSTAHYDLDVNRIYLNRTVRFRFLGWNNSNNNTQGDVLVSSPLNIGAKWQFGLSLFAKNSYNQLVSPSYFLIDGRQSNSTPFLDENEAHQIQGVYYDGVLMPVSINVTQNSPPTLNLSLPIYPLTIRTMDYFDSPVNASVVLLYKNGTRVETFTGNEGLLNISNVPYGSAVAAVDYFGMQESLQTTSGIQVFARFPSVLNVSALIGLLVLFVFSVERYKARVRARQALGGKL